METAEQVAALRRQEEFQVLDAPGELVGHAAEEFVQARAGASGDEKGIGEMPPQEVERRFVAEQVDLVEHREDALVLRAEFRQHVHRGAVKGENLRLRGVEQVHQEIREQRLL